MRLSFLGAAFCLLGLSSFSSAAKNSLTVHITNKSDFCFVLPKQKQSIGDAEHPGGLKVYCTKPISGQGTLASDIFTGSGPHITRGNGYGAYKQITGCFNPRKVPTLQPNDDGGQVDSNGGAGGRGNPANSACAGYAGYVSLIEPSANRICLRCCSDLRDCDTSRDTSGCPTVIRGNYQGCS